MKGLHSVVVGAGIGGLSAGLRLAARGHRVAVVERSPHVGGKMRPERLGAHSLDAGPTVLTMRSVFDELFADTGASLDDYVQLRPLEILARHAWPDGSRLDLHADPDASAAAIDAFAGPCAADGYRSFCAYAQNILRAVDKPFMQSSPTSLLGLIRHSSWRDLRSFAGIDWHRSMWKALGDFFPDPRLRQLFARYATYYGSSPFSAPATLNLIAHVEARGVWTVTGGMHRLAESLAQRLEELGGQIMLERHVERIELDARGEACGVALAGGETLAAPNIVFNGDPHALRDGLMGKAVRSAVKLPRNEVRSLSAVTLAIAGRTNGFDLARHNVFFSDDYEREFVSIFEEGRVPDVPTVYVCAQDRDAPEPTPEVERLLVLINAPARGDDDRAELDPKTCKTTTMELLARCGLQLQTEAVVTTTPRTFANRFPGTGGALYGTATHGPFSAFSRPGPRSRIPGLYLVGGGVHPGAGVPMVATGGRLAAEAVHEDQRSMPQSRPAATCGGTSTASPTTVATP